MNSGDCYTLLALAHGEQEQQIKYQEEVNREDAVANQGFRGVRTLGGTTINPGSVLSKVAGETITKELDYLISVDEVGELIGDAIGLTWLRLESLLNEQLGPQ